MNKSVDTNEINLDISEEIGKYSHNFIPPMLLPKFHPSKSLKDILYEKKSQILKEFKSNLKMSTTSVEFKANLFFVKVKMILEPNKIIVYKLIPGQSENDIFNPLVYLDFDMVTAEVSISKKDKSNKFSIYVLGASNKFTFVAANEQIYQTILIRLNYFIENSLGTKTNLLGISMRKDFSKVILTLK